MPILSFQSIHFGDKSIGGKAWGLAQLSKAGFPVPEGLILTSEPNESEFDEIERWWRERNLCPLAIRSSAAAEDSAETSFAGQNRSFLNVRSPNELRDSTRACFESGRSSSSLAYRRHFTGAEAEGAMNVVVQEMVDARFSGVFFSQDPRTGGDWILEVIPGLGEDLVSGKVSPGRFGASGEKARLPGGFSIDDAKKVAEIGRNIAASLGFPVDMEWAIDHEGRLRVLQARPITAHGESTSELLIEEELSRLTSSHSVGTTWDGQTFAEWNEAPSPFTLSVWRLAFSPHHAFGDALHELGYRGFPDRELLPKDSLLEDVFGRAYVNLDRLSDLYYGPIPYSIEARPRPHTRFDARKLSWSVIAHMPLAVSSMLKVAWNVSSRRRTWLQLSATALEQQKKRFTESRDSRCLQDLSVRELCDLLQVDVASFTTTWLHWPLLLVVLTESTIQSLRMTLQSVAGENEADRLLREWMAVGIHTITRDMMEEMRDATMDATRRPLFLARFGHRGPGEMDLAKPRWAEMGDAAFRGRGVVRSKSTSTKTVDVEVEIAKMKTIKRDFILEEWRLFKRMLEHREQWKMELLKPYARIRSILVEIGKRIGLGEDILWLENSEIAALSEPFSIQEARVKIAQRRRRQAAFRGVALPDVLSLSSLKGLITDRGSPSGGSLVGDPLSPGLVLGQIRYVEDPSKVKLEEWPDDVILAAPATDPGWTELFLRAKAIIVERGGVLSHCAIVARELSIPAVSGILNLRSRFHDGDRVWVDGNTGRLRIEEREK